MNAARIHIFGAAGSGASSLGAALACELALPHFDADNYGWHKTEPPYQERRARAERKELLRKEISRRDRWILTGAISGWGDFLVPQITLVAFIHTSTPIRLQRLAARQARMFGADAIAPGGQFQDQHEKFMAWASGYDSPAFDGRSRAKHEAWLRRIPCPKIRVNGLTQPHHAIATILGMLQIFP